MLMSQLLGKVIHCMLKLGNVIGKDVVVRPSSCCRATAPWFPSAFPTRITRKACSKCARC